jgi:hypothetical protein
MTWLLDHWILMFSVASLIVSVASLYYAIKVYKRIAEKEKLRKEA